MVNATTHYHYLFPNFPALGKCRSTLLLFAARPCWSAGAETSVVGIGWAVEWSYKLDQCGLAAGVFKSNEMWFTSRHKLICSCQPYTDLEHCIVSRWDASNITMSTMTSHIFHLCVTRYSTFSEELLIFRNSFHRSYSTRSVFLLSFTFRSHNNSYNNNNHDRH